MKTLPKKLQIYLVILYVVTPLSIYLLVHSRYFEFNLASSVDILFFIIFTALTETFTVSYKNLSVSTTAAVTIASFILFGPITAIIINLIGFSIRIVKVNDKIIHIFNTPIYKTIYNYCLFALMVVCGSFVYHFMGGEYPAGSISNNLIQIAGFVITFFIVNVLLISILFSIISNKNIFYCIISQVKLIALNSLVMAPFGIILAFIFNTYYKYFGILLFIFPIVLSRYTFALYIEAKNKYIQTVDSLMRAVEARDKYTEGHSQRVAQLVETIARELKYNDWKIEQLNIAALLHDVGKIGIDDHILNKPGKLSEEEFNIIKGHPEIGYNILKDIDGFKNIINIVKHHHERYDGKGYPSGKRVDELSLDIFIVQLADSIDAMATDRPYRKALTEEEILEEIQKNCGTQFHPEVVEAYRRVLKNKVTKE